MALFLRAGTSPEGSQLARSPKKGMEPERRATWS